MLRLQAKSGITDHMPICPLACRTGLFSTPQGTNIPEFQQNLSGHKNTFVEFVFKSCETRKKSIAISGLNMTAGSKAFLMSVITAVLNNFYT